MLIQNIEINPSKVLYFRCKINKLILIKYTIRYDKKGFFGSTAVIIICLLGIYI